MKYRFSIHMIRNSTVVMAVALVVGVPVTETPIGANGFSIAASAQVETGPIVLAQYNPCPNRRCR
jgi:hypothetical protein